MIDRLQKCDTTHQVSLSRNLKVAQAILDPKVGLRFQRRGGDVWLWHRDTPVWRWQFEGITPWCISNLDQLSRCLQHYLDQPKVELRTGKYRFPEIDFWEYGGKAQASNLRRLYDIMLAADIRLGRTHLPRIMVLQAMTLPATIASERLRNRRRH